MKSSLPSHIVYESSQHAFYDRELKRTYPVKKKPHVECYYINVGNTKYTVTDIIAKYDHVFRYIFDGWMIDYPCPAFHYWYVRYREGERITHAQFKVKYQQYFSYTLQKRKEYASLYATKRERYRQRGTAVQPARAAY